MIENRISARIPSTLSFFSAVSPNYSIGSCNLGHGLSFYVETVLGPLHMSPVTGLARLPGRILWCVYMGNLSPVDRDEFKKLNQNREHKLTLFATVIAFWTLVTLLIKLFRILLKWEYIRDQNYAILVAI